MGAQTAIDWLVDVGKVSGIRHVDHPGKLVSDFPAAEVYLERGSNEASTLSNQFGYGIHTMSIAIHWSLDGVADNMKEINAMVDKFPQRVISMIDDPRIVLVEALDYQLFGGDVQKVKTHGVIFTLVVHTEEKQEK